jgi:hypothetical protein
LHGQRRWWWRGRHGRVGPATRPCKTSIRSSSASGNLDARDGATYRADSVIKYRAIPYDFGLVVDRPNKRYAAYGSWNGQPEVTIGTNLAYRDSARPATKFDHWAVQAVSAKTTVCGFITRAN